MISRNILQLEAVQGASTGVTRRTQALGAYSRGLETSVLRGRSTHVLFHLMRSRSLCSPPKRANADMRLDKIRSFEGDHMTWPISTFFPVNLALLDRRIPPSRRAINRWGAVRYGAQVLYRRIALLHTTRVLRLRRLLYVRVIDDACLSRESKARAQSARYTHEQDRKLFAVDFLVLNHARTSMIHNEIQKNKVSFLDDELLLCE